MKFTFKEGDIAYYTGEHNLYTNKLCPACEGRMHSLVMQGKGKYEIECQWCSISPNTPTGYVNEFSYNENHTPIEVTIVELTEFDNRTERYNFNVNITNEVNTLKSSRREGKVGETLFKNLADCQKECNKLNKQAKEANDRIIESRLKNTAAKAAWTVGYLKNRIKDAEKQIAYCKAKLNEIK